MNPFRSWLRRWLSIASTPVRPVCASRALRARLALEALEDRLSPTVTPTNVPYSIWAQQRIHLDDVTVARPTLTQSAAAQSTATNNSFGAQIGLNKVLS